MYPFHGQSLEKGCVPSVGVSLPVIRMLSVSGVRVLLVMIAQPNNDKAGGLLEHGVLLVLAHWWGVCK